MLYKGMSVNHLVVTNLGADGAGEGGFASSPNIWYLCKNRRNKLDMTKRIFPIAALAAFLMAAPCAIAQDKVQESPVVYFTRDISPEGLLKVYKALDKFCLDQVMNLPQDKNNDTKALLNRIEQRHGTRIVFRGEEMGLGSTKYQVVDLDAKPGQSALDVIFSRKSVRTYADKPVSEEQEETLLKAAMAAPTGMNVQPWRFVVVRDQPKDKWKPENIHYDKW